MYSFVRMKHVEDKNSAAPHQFYFAFRASNLLVNSFHLKIEDGGQ
jgi:hypothetical protein